MDIRAAKATLTIAVRDNRDRTKFDVDIAEARFNLRDVRGILSHTLVPYTQQTGRAVLKEHDRVRQIVAASTHQQAFVRTGAAATGRSQQVLGQHFPIPVGM